MNDGSALDESSRLQVPNGTDLVEWYFERGWTDGMPVVSNAGCHRATAA
jgi:hypothetical protein